MKHLKFLFLFIGLTIFASCSESDVEGGIIGDANKANFSATIGELKTRVTGSSWDAGDAIGIYALKADQALSDAAIFDGKSNVKFTTTGDGSFTSTTPINFIDDANLDFVSYYPYQAAITAYKYNIDVTTQSNLAAIDLLYSNNAKGQNATNPNVNLDFKHMLSKLIFNIELGDNLSSLAGLTASINNIVVSGNLALANGVVTTGTTKAAITPNLIIAGGNAMATVTAIVVPGQNLNDVQIEFNLGQYNYLWTPPTQELKSSMKYEYKLKLNIDGSQPTVVPVEVGATITDWADGYIGDEFIYLDPETDGEASIITNAQALTFAKESGNKEIIVTANVDWTAASNAGWLTINPTSGSNNGIITATAAANAGAERNANITITNGTITKTVAVTQAASGVTPPSNPLLFPGSDFNNWTTFTNSLNSFGITFGKESATGGRNGSGAMHFEGQHDKNAYVFTVVVPEGFSAAGKTKINFWVKGTAVKSLSMNVYVGPENVMGIDYKSYNMDEYAPYNSHQVLEPTDANSYTKGGIDTGGAWIQVSLNISSLAINTTPGANLFALKVGSKSDYNLFVDDITFE